MSILNPSLGRANKYCRSCLTNRNDYSKIGILRDSQLHCEIIEGLEFNEFEENEVQSDFGINKNNDLKLQKYNNFSLFEDFPFDILHSVYMGLVKHALIETFENFMKEKEEIFLIYLYAT